MSLYPVGQGLLATALAAVVVAAWLAIGSIFVGSLRNHEDAAPGAAILVGSALTSFCLALFSAGAMVREGVIITGTASVIVLAIRWRESLRLFSVSLEPWREIGQGIVARTSLAAIALIVWTAAISPPRSADAMRYHLAHIRQIVSEGRWVPINDYHYALPFGWSLSYLPFEMLGIPQGAQLLGVALLLVVFGSVIRALRGYGVGRGGMLVASLMLLHPAVLRGFSEANADGYALLAILVIAVMLVRLRAFGSQQMALLGFVSWIGMQSRYQLAAAGIAATVVFVIALRDTEGRPGALISYAIGSVTALVLASPFYAMNYIGLRNPVWPLMISRPDSAGSYANAMAYDYSKSLTGSYSPLAILESLWTLVSKPFLLPLSIAILCFVLLGLFARRNEAKTIGLFGAVFFVLWLAMAPLLYPRFVLLLLPVAALCAGVVADTWIRRSAIGSGWYGRIAVTTLATLALVSAIVFRDSVRYVATGDLEEYHTYTWFYPVYQWMNRATPAGSRVLVVVSSAQTYYLERPYRRADPWISGVVDWNATSTGNALDRLMTSKGYQYLLYEDRDWRDFRGGELMHTAVSQAVAQGSLVPVRKFSERLYSSRLWRRYRTTPVYVLKHVASINEAPR